MNNIAIILARSGSKGIPDKNIRSINGKPLFAYTIEAALKSQVFSEVMVSTDSEQYAEIAQKFGASVPFLRSRTMSGDKSSSWDAVREVLSGYAQRGIAFDNLALLQPTSPLRDAEDIKRAFEIFVDRKANAVVSVTESRHDYNGLPEDLSMVGFYDDRKYKTRQEKKGLYYINGAIYLYNIQAFNRQGTIYDEACYAYIMDSIHSVDIDEYRDLVLAEALLKNMEIFDNEEKYSERFSVYKNSSMEKAGEII